MRNLIAILAISSIGSSCYAQTPSFSGKDTLHFAADSSYSRAIIRHKGNLLFATSKTGVISYNEKTKKTVTIIDPVPYGEFRDVAVYKKKIVAMVSGDNGILMTPGNKIVFYEPGVFFDDLTVNKEGPIVLGDPVDGAFYVAFLQLTDSARYRIQIGCTIKDSSEACYAASGTTAFLFSKEDYCFVSGGKAGSNFYGSTYRHNWDGFDVPLPMAKGEGAGAFSVYFTDRRHGMVVGGNYTKPNDTTGTAAYTTDGGFTWQQAVTFPKGYRSCVTGNKKVQFACGTNGIDYSTDGGKTWHFFDKGNFCALLVEKKFLYATTNKGYCIRYRLI